MMYSRLATRSLPWLLSLLLVTACTPNPLAPQTQTISITQSTMTAHTSQFKKGPYHGPVTLTVDTGLILGKVGKKVTIPSVSDDPDFQIQALPAGNMMFQTSFTKALGQTLEQTRTISIADTSKRYTLHVQKDSLAGQVEVNINGTDWIKAQDFGLLGREAVNKTLLLQANNTLRIRIQGLLRSQVTVTLVEGGEAGVVRKRQGKISSLNETQADRVRQNDTNIFDPNQPDSLGGLQPYEGDIGDNKSDLNPLQDIAIGGVKLNYQEQTEFAIGQLFVVLKNTNNNDFSILNTHPGILTIRHEELANDLRIVRIWLNLENISLTTLETDIIALNQRAELPTLTDLTFSSINAAKTLATALQILRQYPELIESVGMINTVEKTSNDTPIITQEEKRQTLSVTSPGVYSFDRDLVSKLTTRGITLTDPGMYQSSDMWWLGNETTSVTSAWNYSTGFDSTIAVLDDGFGHIHRDSEFQSHFLACQLQPREDKKVCGSEGTKQESRVLHEPFFLYSSSIQSSNDPDACKLSSRGEILFPSKCLYHDQAALPISSIQTPPQQSYFDALLNYEDYRFLYPTHRQASSLHGLRVSSIATASANNQWGLAGVAPSSKLLPVVTAESRLLIDDGQKALEGFFINIFLRISQLNVYTDTKKMVDPNFSLDVINISQALRPTSIDDFLKSTTFDTSANLSLMEKVIKNIQTKHNTVVVVAAANNNIEINKSQVVYPASLDSVITIGSYKRPSNGVFSKAEISNFGAEVDIWAPDGLEIPTLVPALFYDFPSIGDTSAGVENWHTESGTSFATPIVAGTVALMKTWNKSLTPQQIKSILQSTSRQLGYFNGLPAHGLNALEAVKHPSVGAKKAKTLTLQVNFSGDLTDENGKIYQTIPDYQKTNPEILPGQYVRVSGWTQEDHPNIPLGKIQLLQIEPTAGIESCVTDEIVTNTTDWRWRDNNGNLQAPVVNSVMTNRISPTTDGRPVVTIWSQLYSNGLAYCLVCDYDFSHNYVVPPEREVKSAKVEVQVDDGVDIYVNNYLVGSATRGETYGSNQVKTLPIAPNVFSTGQSFLMNVRNRSNYQIYNNAGIAAKFTVEHCPRNTAIM